MEGEEMSDSDDEEVELEAVNANMMGADYFSSDDEEEEAVEYNDLDGPEAEPFHVLGKRTLSMFRTLCCIPESTPIVLRVDSQSP